MAEVDVERFREFEHAGWEQEPSIASGDDLFHAFRDGTVRTAGLLREQIEAERTAILISAVKC
jgi:hypothetical protein